MNVSSTLKFVFLAAGLSCAVSLSPAHGQEDADRLEIHPVQPQADAEVGDAELADAEARRRAQMAKNRVKVLEKDDKVLAEYRKRAAENRAKAAAQAEAARKKEKPAPDEAAPDEAARNGAAAKAIGEAAGAIFDNLFMPFRPQPVHVWNEPPPVPVLQEAEVMMVFDNAVDIAVEVPVAQAVAANGELNDNERMWLQHLTPQLRTELSMVRVACDLDQKQFDAISDAAEKSLSKVAKQYAADQQRPRRVVMVNNIQRIEPPQKTPREMIDEALAKLLEKEFPDVAERFTEETAQRLQFEKDATVKMLVTCLDEQLFFDDEQREAVEKTLHENWDQQWAQYLQGMMYSSSSAPPVPAKVLEPILRKEQLEVLKAKVDPNGIRGRVMIQAF